MWHNSKKKQKKKVGNNAKSQIRRTSNTGNKNKSAKPNKCRIKLQI